MLVGIGDAAVVFFLIGIIDRIGIGIAALQNCSMKFSRSSFVCNCRKALR